MYSVPVYGNTLRRFSFIILRLLLVFLVSSSTAQAGESITGQVTRVFDGDTVEIKDGSNVIHRIRLQGIDAPERGQPFNRKSRNVLSDLVFGKDIRVATEGKDKYDRYLGHVYLGDTWINREMVRRGMAWHYKYFTRDPRLAHSEIYARYERLGLWLEPDPTAPWVYRRYQSADKSAVKPENSSEFWLNTSTGVRHNRSCRHFMNTNKGRFCGPNEGRPCRECGG